MSFDLWSALGVSPMTAVAVAAGGLALAALIAVRTLWRDRARSASASGLRLNDGPAGEKRR